MEASHQATLSDSGEAPLFNQYILDIENLALASVAQWIECRPVNGQVTGSMPSQGGRSGCRPRPPLGVGERQPVAVSLTHWCFSLLSPSPSPLSKNK